MFQRFLTRHMAAARIFSPKKFIELEFRWHRPQILLHENNKLRVQDVTEENKNLLMEEEVKKTVGFLLVGGSELIGNVLAYERLESWRN